MGDEHVGKDKLVTWKFVEETKNLVKKHMTAMVNMFQVSKEWGQGEEGRIREALKQQKTVIPQSSVQPKDNKPIPASGIPKSSFSNFGCIHN